MKRIAIIVMLLVGCVIHPNMAKAQKVKDAFVLVDVSASMKYSHINSEAKQIISSMLQGNLVLSNFSGWSQVKIKGLDGTCPLISGNSSSLISAGGKVCILPFGNMGRVKDYKFVDMSNFENSFNAYFPDTFKDDWTYITLAKAHAVNVASKNGISGMVYMIIYSDGAQESMKGSVGYSKEDQEIVDYFGTCADSFCQKKGIIRKSYNGKNFDIEIWTMGPIPIAESPVDGETVQKKPMVQKKIEISNQPKGKSPKVPIDINVKETFTVQWKNATGPTTINVQRKKDNTYANISKAEKDSYYTIDKKGSTFAEITFYEPQDYKVIVADSNSRDERYVKAKRNVLPDVFPIIIIVILIIGGVLLWDLLSKPKLPDPNPDGDKGNRHDDWS